MRSMLLTLNLNLQVTGRILLIFPKNLKLKGTEVITLDIPEAEPDTAEPENIPLNIVYEDVDIFEHTVKLRGVGYSDVV